MSRQVKSWMYALLTALALVALLRLLVCTTCIMPSGELLFINKWSYGLRTPLPSLFGYHRISPQPVGRGDKVAFDNPLEEGPSEFRQLFVCRCAASTGEIILLHEAPFQIPRKGDTVLVTPANKAILHEVISQHEGKQAIIGTDGKLYVDGSPIKKYTFTRSYYWMEVGKEERLLDSRNFGLVPEELVIGRVFYGIQTPFRRQ